MPIYEDENKTSEDLFELRKRNRCQVCRGALYVFLDRENHKAFLACWDWPRTHHEGIEREAEPPFEPNIPTRRTFMEQQHEKTKAVALRRFDAVATLDRKSAREILTILWPRAEKASPAEFAKAMGLCVDYGLDPRLNELFLIPFKERDKAGNVIGVTYETVRGIRATRKVALRRHHYSYIDLTPRLMTKEEEEKAYSKPDPDKIRFITKLKDLDTGAEAPGYGEWARYKVVNGKRVANNPKGIDKGNSMENMAAIRSERAALERLYPADMPPSRIPVVDEQFIDAEYREVTEDEQESLETEGENEAEGGGEKTEPTFVEPEIEGDGFNIDLTWLKESQKALKWTDDTCKTFLVSQYKVSPEGTLEDVIKRLTREQAEKFVEDINRRTEKQSGLFE